MYKEAWLENLIDHNLTRCNKVGVTNVNTVVHTQTNRDDNVYARYNVNMNIPKVEEASNVHQGNTHHHHDHEADLNVGQQQEGDTEDAG